MGAYHRLGFAFVLVSLIMISLFVSIGGSAQMLQYDESEIYSCPDDFADNAAWIMSEQTADSKVTDKQVTKTAFGQV